MKKSLLILLPILFLVSCSKKDDDAVTEKCDAAVYLDVSHISPNIVELSWNIATYEPNNLFIVEYGPKGFAPGSGTIVDTQEFRLTVSNLEAGTEYSFYVKTKCSNNIFSENAGPKNFTTIECEALEKISVYDITETTAHLVWYMATEVSELEYGPTGFVMGT